MHLHKDQLKDASPILYNDNLGYSRKQLRKGEKVKYFFLPTPMLLFEICPGLKVQELDALQFLIAESILP